MGADKRLDASFQDAPVLPLSPASRYVLFSDCHRGIGTANDNFLKNQNLYFAALQYYYQNQFTYIELGDGDELWENRSFDMIKSIHNNAFWMLSRYYKDHRLYMIYGNHDMVKKYKSYALQNYFFYPCSTCREEELFPGIQFYPGIILKNTASSKDLYLTHGHQADFLNSVLWKTSRFLVRYIWRPLEHTGVLDPTSAAKNNTRKKKTEQILSDWARKNHCLLVTGHTHRPRLSASDPYYNTGSCVHPRCITCIEITDLCMTLVKWTLATRPDRTLFVAREILAGPVSLAEPKNECCKSEADMLTLDTV